MDFIYKKKKKFKIANYPYFAKGLSITILIKDFNYYFFYNYIYMGINLYRSCLSTQLISKAPYIGVKYYLYQCINCCSSLSFN